MDSINRRTFIGLSATAFMRSLLLELVPIPKLNWNAEASGSGSEHALSGRRESNGDTFLVAGTGIRKIHEWIVTSIIGIFQSTIESLIPWLRLKICPRRNIRT